MPSLAEHLKKGSAIHKVKQLEKGTVVARAPNPTTQCFSWLNIKERR